MDELDELTGVFTRGTITEKLDQALSGAAATGETITLIFLDLDHFMRFNEEYGHQVGDAWLKAIMDLFKDAFGQDQMTGRYGGDEFVAAVRGRETGSIYERAEELRRLIEQDGPAVSVEGRQVQPGYTVTIGLAAYPDDAVSVSGLVEKARQALYRAKEAGGNMVCFFEEKDALTGVYNQYGITRKLDEVLAGARKQREAVSILMVDIDQFKLLNDEFGRRGGDEVLKRVAGIFTSNFEGEIVGRLYGDSFVVVFPGKRADSAFVLAEEVRRVLEDTGIDFTVGKTKRAVGFRISGGIATFPNDATDRVDLLRKADEALYRAKQTGRNRICLPASAQMVTKTSHYTQTQLERLAAVAKDLEKSEAFLLREALDDLLRKYGDRPGEG
jgi:diguanylate cyclase